MGSPRPAVSVVIPTRNRAAIVERAVLSALAQTAPPREVIVVDDASTDDTAGLLERYAGDGVQVLRMPEHGGGGRARNLGIEAARGDWVAFLDSDDEWRPQKLERQLDRLEAPDGPGLSVVYCRRIGFDHLMGRQYPVPIPLHEGDVFAAVLIGWEVATSQVMVSRAALTRIGGFDPVLPGSQDYDLWLRLAAAGYLFGGVPEALVVKHEHLVPQMTADPGAKERALAILDEKWRATIVRQFGERHHARWIARRRVVIAYSYLMQVLEAAALGERRLARHYCRAMLRAGGFPVMYFAHAVCIALLGWPAYRGLARQWRRLRAALPRRPSKGASTG